MPVPLSAADPAPADADDRVTSLLLVLDAIRHGDKGPSEAVDARVGMALGGAALSAQRG